MKRTNWWIIAAVVGFFALGGWLYALDMKAMNSPEMRKKSEDWWEQRRKATQSTPERWAKCREVCGESAALLPVGDGNFGVVCSCVPKNWRTAP